MGWNQISTYQSFGQDTWQHFLIEKSSGPSWKIASVFLFLCYLLLTLEPPAKAKECQEGFVTFVWTQSSDVLSRHIEMWYGFSVEKLDPEPRIPKTSRQLLVFLNAKVVRRDMLEDFDNGQSILEKRCGLVSTPYASCSLPTPVVTCQVCPWQTTRPKWVWWSLAE